MTKIFILVFCFLVINSQIFSNIIFVSDRDEFHNPEELSPTQVKKKVLHKTPFKFDPISQQSWIDEIRDKKVALLIHGYKNETEDSIEFFSSIIDGADSSYETFVCYLWPGYDDFWEYFEAENMVTKTNLPMRLLGLMEEIFLHAQQIDVISFSMGCKLALEALNLSNQTLVKNLFLLAPAIDNEALEDGEKYAPATNNVQKTFVFYSENDHTLKWVYPFIALDLALGWKGMEKPTDNSANVYMIDCSHHINDHHDYAKSSFIHTIISNILKIDAK